VFSGLRLKMVVRFVYIGGIVDHYCLNSLFITVSYKGLDTFLSSLLWLVYVCLMMVFNATFNNISVIL
jgi:hypothetical protein